MITYAELIDSLEYNVDTGIFTWKYNKSSRAMKGSIAGTLCKDGYISININRKIYRAHRLAWLYCFQQWPVTYIDHINGVRNDNRLDNLREANMLENSHNSKVHKDSKTGIKGVYYNKLNSNYRAQIYYKGNRISLGSFKTVEEAALAYSTMAVEIHGEFYTSRS